MVPSKSHSKQIIKLYGYQEIAFKKVVAALKNTFQALVVMATGLGKTILSIEVVKYFLTPKDKVLFLCHDNGILNKAYKDYQKFIGNSYTYAKFYGKDKNWEADKHHFVFATFQSVFAHLQNERERKKLFSPKHFSFIVVDESHHSQAETFAEVINYFKPKYKLGMTATPDREDNADIRDIFGNEVVDIRLPEAIAKNWLTKVDYKVLSDGLDEDKIREVCKEVMEDNIRLTENQINEKIFIKVRTEEQCRIVQKYSKKQKAIVFCENIEHLQHVASILPSSVAIHSDQSDKVNDFNFNLFEHGHVRHVIVVDKFNEGIDIPDTELLVFLRTTNSERIFLQQLGRGLRPVLGKEKVTVLDFVANIDRIRQVAKLTNEIEHIARNHREKNKQTLDKSFHVEGKGFSFDFSDQVVNLLSVFEKIEQDFYPIWQEASAAIVALGIRDVNTYKEKYKLDNRLPSTPHAYYRNFPGYPVLFGFEKKSFYPTCEEASQASRALGIRTHREYQSKYRLDKRLTSDPKKIYADFPGWHAYLVGKEKNIYPTWQEASESVKKLGITKSKEYDRLYKKDDRLPSNPTQYYSDFPGWAIFLGINNKKKKKKEFYPSCHDASAAAIKLNIKNQREYMERYKEDSKLPVDPKEIYEDFPGFTEFLGTAFYSNWQLASEKCIALSIRSKEEYQQRYKEDSQLPSGPARKYKDFPGWKVFLGKE